MKIPKTIDGALLTADLKKFAEIYCKTVQDTAAKEITTLAKMAMQSYYEAYDPQYYDPRTNQMRNSSFQEYKEIVGNEYRGGIKINPDFTNHIPKGVEESDIYNFVWELGSHGVELLPRGNRIIYGKDEPKNRYEEIEKIVYSRKKKQEYNAKGMNAAKKGAYTLLHFD